MIAQRLRSIASSIVICLAFVTIAVLALNNLITHINTAMPGVVNVQASDQIQPSEFDIFYWNLWWVRHATFDLHISPLYTNYIVYPFTSPLAGHTLALLWGLISAPFQIGLGLITTYNLIIVVSFVLAALCMYLFVKRHVERRGVALVGGLIFAFTPAMLHRASVGHLDKLSIFWLPLVLLVWDKVIESRRWTWAMTLGIALWFSWLTDFQQTMWALLLLVPYITYTLISLQRRRDAEDNKKSLASVSLRLIIITSAAFIIPSLFAPLPQLIEANRLNYPPARVEDTAAFAFPLQNFFNPGENGDFSIGVLLPLGTVLSVLFIRRDRKRWLWLLIGAGCFILALGPYIVIGSTRVPLPYAIVHVLLGNQYRTPMRFATPGVFAWTMLLVLTLDRFFVWLQLHLTPQALSFTRTSIPIILAALYIFDYHLLQPFPITQMPDYSIYHTLASMPGNFAVLELPIGVRTGFAVVGRGEYLQYYEPIHQHPIPSGYLSRLPTEITDTFYFDPLIGALTLSHSLPPQAQVDAALNQLIESWHIGYVILHRDLLEPGRVKSFGDLLNRQPALEKIGEEGPLVIYRTNLHE
ncbi:MAG TPA: hypothetical protein VFK30_02750 [Anaerolineae bacterium]|nr:hypothetical protein [Anaerolineae bacterium]